MTSATLFRLVAQEMRRRPATTDMAVVGVVEGAIAYAVERTETTDDAEALLAELVQIFAASTVRISRAAHGGRACSICLTRLAFNFDRLLQADAERDAASPGGLN